MREAMKRDEVPLSVGRISRRGNRRAVRRTTIREVIGVEVHENEALVRRLIEIEIEADAFLYQMVRNIVGALIEVGQGDLTAKNIRNLTAGRDRTKCPPPAPPQGLCLVQVKY